MGKRDVLLVVQPRQEVNHSFAEVLLFVSELSHIGTVPASKRFGPAVNAYDRARISFRDAC